MTWIFGSFLVTPYVLASCHILISKQADDSTTRALGYDRCVTGKRPRDENHVVRFVQRIVGERGTFSWLEASLTSLQVGARFGTPWLLEEDMGRSPLSEICLSIYLSTHNGPLEDKMRDIFIKKCVRSFIEVHKSMLRLWLYNSNTCNHFIVFKKWDLTCFKMISINKVFIDNLIWHK